MIRALCTALLLALAMTTGTAVAAEPKASLPDIEDEVMCVSCKVALNVAESPQAYRERELIRSLVEQGLTKDQIKARLVDEYGENVLAVPKSDDGIGLTAMLVPILAVLALIGGMALLLPRWRQRARQAQAAPAAAGPKVTDAELHRLDDDLRRFDRA
jgi:cytochrome c-type biogenesis protein CcmH